MHIANESDLHKMGYQVDPADPNKILPLPQPPANASVAELETLAQQEYQSILQSERKTAAQYWLLGDYLTRLKTTCPHGNWEHYVTSTLKIDPNRARRAIRVRKRHESVSECSEQTIWEALQYDNKKEPNPSTSQQPKAPSRQRNPSLTMFEADGDTENDKAKENDFTNGYWKADEKEETEEPHLSDDDIKAAQQFVESVGSDRAEYVLEHYLDSIFSSALV